MSAAESIAAQISSSSTTNPNTTVSAKYISSTQSHEARNASMQLMRNQKAREINAYLENWKQQATSVSSISDYYKQTQSKARQNALQQHPLRMQKRKAWLKHLGKRVQPVQSWKRVQPVQSGKWTKTMSGGTKKQFLYKNNSRKKTSVRNKKLKCK